MKIKHTSGEWQPVVLDLADYKQCCVGSVASGRVVAHVLVFGDTISEEDKANTKLIAAAPDLLNALINLMKGVDGLPPMSSIQGVLEQQYKQAEEAIKKATV